MGETSWLTLHGTIMLQGGINPITVMNSLVLEEVPNMYGYFISQTE